MYAFRQAELVGKRFLCVREKNSLRPNSRSSRVSNPLGYQWKVGVIRACSEKDFHHPELKVLVEYDNEDWTTREWLTIYDGSWKIFLVEKTMVWSQRPDPSNPRRPLLWPALTFSPLVDKHGLSDEDRPVPVEFVGDHERMFVRGDECRPYGQDDDGLQPALRNNPNVMEELCDWQRVQKSQSILLDGPFTLTGFRVQVYRQTCRQWYSAVITGHDLMSRELSCMDDTVLQTHRVDPRLTQVILLANETELDSLLRGELVRVLPMRQHRHSQVIITAPLTTQTTSNSLSSTAPTTWQLYAGLTHSTNSNNHLQALSSTQAVFSSPAVSTVTNRQISSRSPPNVQGTDANKERKKSTETRNRSSASRRVTRSDSTSSTSSLSDTQQRTPQTIQSPLTTPSATSLSSSIRSASHTSSQQSYKTSPPDAHTMSPKRSSSSSSLGSPSLSIQKMSPIKQPASPKTSPSVLHYGSPSKAGMSNMGSPFRSNPFCSSPDMSVVSMASPLSGMSHIGMCSPGHMVYSRAQSPHPLYSHSMGHLNISPPQLYALQFQQQQKQMLSPEQQEFLAKLQHQHHQSLMNQYQMHHYQLQLMLQQQEIMKQMPLTLEQQHVLAERYNQLLYQYQCAQIFQQLAAVTQDEQLSMYHGTDDRTRVLPERIQQQLREAQERQKQELQHLMPRLEPEQLQTFFTCLQQRSMTSDQIKELYTLLIQQQEAQKRQPQHDERQRLTIQDILHQNQEDVKKILQLQQSPSRSKDVENKDEPKQEASNSSAQPESPSSSASSFTVHYMPTPCDSGASSDSNGKDKPEKDASVGKSTSETSKAEAKPSVDEIELKSTTTDEERSSSPHAILEKLLQHHLEAVKLESKQQASAKARRTGASSTEKRSKRQRKSAELSSARIQDDENNSAEKDNQNFREAAVTRNSFTTDPLPCPLTGDVSRETTNTSVNHTFSLNDSDSVPREQKLPKNLGFVDSHLSEAKKQNKTAHEQMNTSLRPEQRYPLEREDTSLMTSGRVATGDVVKEAPRENIRLKDSAKTRKERTPVMDKQNKVADISKDNAQVTKNEKATSLNQKLSEKASAKSTAAEQAQPSELVSLLKTKSSRLAGEVRTEGSNSVAAKTISANEPEGGVLEETSSISLQNQGAKTQNNLSAKDVTVEKPQSQFFGHTPPIFPGKETCSGSENVSSKSSVQDQPTESLLEKRSEQVPVKEDKRAANILPTVTEKGLLELTTLRGKRKTTGKLTVVELSKPTPLSLTRKSFHDAAKAAANLSPDKLSRKSQDNQSAADVSQDKQFGQSQDNSSVQLQDKTSNAMEVDNFPASQKPPAIPDARQLTTNCFSVFSSNSSDHNGELFADKGLKTYSRRITPNKRKSISTSKENITERSTVISKVLKMDNSESLDADCNKVEAHENGNKMDNQVPDSDLSKNSQLEQKSIKRQQNSRTKGKISRKKSTSENKIPAKRAKSGDSYCDNTEAIQNNSQMELEGEASKLVDSVSFVADQAIEDVTINHSPTLKDVPCEQFDFVKPNDEVLNDKSKEKIREMTSIRKKMKEKEKKKKKKENKNELPAPATVVKKELVDGESLETVVDSVLDEQIAVIYNGEEHQENGAFSFTEIKKEVVVKEEEKTEVVERPKPGRGRKKKEAETKELEKGRKRRGKKQNENNENKVSPNSEQFFLQDKVCSKFSDLPMCRDCRDINVEKTGLEFCRFNMFRRLKKRKNGSVLIAGFQLPEHAAPEDFYPWVAQDQVDMMDKSTSLYILSHIGDQFCSVMQEEKKAITQAGENVKVAYKRAVQGVREMCDVCATTIFNMHWVCHRCGFGVCLDCYNLRVKEREEQPGHAGKRVFEFKWCMCCPGICHQPKYLSVAQIIPKSVLSDLGDELHRARDTWKIVLSDLGDELHRARDAWKIGKTCPCKTFVNDEDKESGAKITEIFHDALDKTDNKEKEKELQNSCKEVVREVTVKLEPGSAAAASESAKSDQARSDELKSDSGSSDLGKSEPPKSDSATSAPLNQNLLAVDSESGEGVDDVNLICDESMGIDSPASHEQLWLTEEKRRNHFSKKAGFGLVEAKPRQNNEISSGLSLLMDYSSSADGSPCESPTKNDNQTKIGAFDFPFVSGLDLLALACEKNGGFSLYENVTKDDQKHNNEAECSKPEPQDEKKDEVIRNGSVLIATPSECTSAESSDEVRQATSIVPDRAGLDPPMDAPHSWLCNGRLLRLLDPRAPGNVKAFEKRWKRGEPVLVSHVDKYMNLDLWTPEAFGKEFGSEIADVVNCRNGVVVERFKVGDFWLGFESIKDRPLDSNGEPMLLKLKDWPPKDDFSEKLPTRFEDLMNNAPLPEYTRRDGSRNLVSRLPDFFVTPDLGPKMYNAYGSAACPKEGTTNLHLDMSDAVNVMVYVGVPRDEGAGEKEREDAIKAVDEACDESQQLRVRQETARIGALWHIYAAEDADKIRECLREVAKERRSKHPSHHDPIHDQCFYLDHDIRQRLKKDYGVEGWAICQCLGDAVFIPAGAPHQVRNLYSCVKVAEDFVSPERIDHCVKMTQEFRHLSDKHTNHEDKLQVKNIIYHAVKDALKSLQHYEKELSSTEELRGKECDRVG